MFRPITRLKMHPKILKTVSSTDSISDPIKDGNSPVKWFKEYREVKKSTDSYLFPHSFLIVILLVTFEFSN